MGGGMGGSGGGARISNLGVGLGHVEAFGISGMVLVNLGASAAPSADGSQVVDGTITRASRPLGMGGDDRNDRNDRKNSLIENRLIE